MRKDKLWGERKLVNSDVLTRPDVAYSSPLEPHFCAHLAQILATTRYEAHASHASDSLFLSDVPYSLLHLCQGWH